MPQMAPINWLMLFFIFSIIFISFNILNYFTLLLMNDNNIKKNKNNKLFMIWKW